MSSDNLPSFQMTDEEAKLFEIILEAFGDNAEQSAIGVIDSLRVAGIRIVDES